MAVVYATLIIKGKKTFADVPDRIKEQVKQVLIDLSLVENAGLMGVPLPAVITKAIDILQKKAEKDGE